MSAVAPLYEVTVDQVAILDAIYDAGGEVTNDVAAQLEASNADFSDVAATIRRLIQNADAEAGKLATERKHLQSREAVLGRMSDNLRVHLQRCMEHVHLTRVEGVARIQKAPPSVIVACAPESLPEEYKRVTTEPRKDALKDAWKAGLTLPEGVSIKTDGRSLVLL